MAKSPRFAEILAFGEALVAQLDERNDDLLSAWMAHYIAECMDAARNGSAKAKANCAKAILELWEHRHELPDGARPFGRLDNVLQTIKALDPTKPRSFYYGDVYAAAKAEDNAEAKKWLTAALNVDAVAKQLISYCLRSAADAVATESRRWVQLARAAGEKGAELIIIRFLAKELPSKKPSPQQAHRKMVKGLVKDLETFSGLASVLHKHLSSELPRPNARARKKPNLRVRR